MDKQIFDKILCFIKFKPKVKFNSETNLLTIFFSNKKKATVVIPTSGSSSENRKYSETFGDNFLTVFIITHNLNDSDISNILIKEVSTGEVVETDKFIVDANNIRLEFNTAPTTDQYRITIKS